MKKRQWSRSRVSTSSRSYICCVNIVRGMGDSGATSTFFATMATAERACTALDRIVLYCPAFTLPGVQFQGALQYKNTQGSVFPWGVNNQTIISRLQESPAGTGQYPLPQM
jgi:hypothetical protein